MLGCCYIFPSAAEHLLPVLKSLQSDLHPAPDLYGSCKEGSLYVLNTDGTGTALGEEVGAGGEMLTNQWM